MRMSLRSMPFLHVIALAAVVALCQGQALCGTPLRGEPPRAPDDPIIARDETPVTWCETMSEGIEEATKKDRPIVLVFPEAAANRHEWFDDYYARAFVKGSDVVCVRMLPPQMPNIPANATPQQRQLYADAFNKLQKEYADLIRKYNVSMVPTIVFLSPDGDTVLRSYTRVMEGTVVNYFRALQSDFENYKKTREAFHKFLQGQKLPAMIKGELPAAKPPASGPGEFGPAIAWHETMAGALAEAAKADKPIMLVLGGGDAERFEWFYGVNGRKTVRESGVIAARVLAPTDVYVPRDAPPAVIDAYRKLKEQLVKDYRDLLQKYNVGSLPTVIFLSPDGEQPFATHTRVMESKVIEYFKVLPGDFENFKKLRKAMGQDKGAKK